MVKVNAKVKVNRGQSQQVQGLSQWSVNNYMIRVSFGFSGRVTDRAAETLTSSYEVALTRIKTCVADDLACLHVIDMDKLMSSWHHQGFLVHGWSMRCPLVYEGEPKNQSTHGGACFNGWPLDFYHKQISGWHGRLGSACGRWMSYTWGNRGGAWEKELGTLFACGGVCNCQWLLDF